MKRISLPPEQIRDRYDAVVIGSGYGGAISASRLARMKKGDGTRLSVRLLERGKEILPGEYPDTELAGASEIQVDLPEEHVGTRTGLYDFHANPDINVFVGCGLGGTSLVNANVSLRAEPRTFEDPLWPQALRDDVNGRLKDGYNRTEEMLEPQPYPESYPALKKLDALEESARAIGAADRFYRPPINVTFEDRVNRAGGEQKKCTCCGDCVSGCNYGAKNTVLMNYLPDARNHGAEIFTLAHVVRIEQRDGLWDVHYQFLHTGREAFDAPTLVVSAELVVLSAGTLGTAEILLRSKQAGLGMSDCVGHRFTGNGDVLAFAYNGDQEIDGVGSGHRDPQHMPPVGPCISGIIDLRNQAVLDDGMVIEEGSIPGAIGSLLPQTFAAAAKIGGTELEHGLPSLVRERAQELDSLVQGPYHGAVRRTQTYLVMSYDDDHGTLFLENDRLRVNWPGVGNLPLFQRISDRLKEASTHLGGMYVTNPLWTKLLHHGLITVHPLGGAVMAEDAAHGVVNHKGQLYAGAAGTDVYDGFYVSDGSVIPRPLGVNPLLTISALAERCCALLAEERGGTIDFDLAEPSAPDTTPLTTGIEFTEKMRGYFAPDAASYEDGFNHGRSNDSPFEFTVTVVSEDVEELVSRADHPARIVGTAVAPLISPEPMTVTAGEFELFATDPDQPESRRMNYRMKLSAVDGHKYYFDGYKLAHPGSPLSIWPDTSTLYITLRDGPGPDGPVLGQGILHIEPADFVRQLTTMKARNARTPEDGLRAVASFGRYFAGSLFDVYGGVALPLQYLNPSAPPRKKRPLRVSAPEVHPFVTEDGVELRLTRYRGGSKGPVILSHGLGVSSRIFSLDTVETNLLEYLFAHGYDVWLLDFRQSIELPAAAQPSTGDDVATKDYPAAVRTVREVTGAETVQMVVHCFGATTFLMAMLAGLEGVRSAVVSQVGTQIFPPLGTEVKCGLHVPEVLERLGFRSLTAYTATNDGWEDRLFDEVLRFQPVPWHQQCDSPVCHRITFLYSRLYQHEQLNEATHQTLHELFSLANIHAFEHLATLVRTGHLVNAAGEEVYLPHLDRLKLPLCFLQGAQNDCFLPAGTQATCDQLGKVNGPDWYTRHLIPNYGHIDCIFGRDAVRDVYPLVLSHLEKTA